MSAAPIWQAALMLREVERLRKSSCGASARLALVRILHQAGEEVSLISVHRWPRHVQGEAYLWARARLLGREDLPAPQYIVDARVSG
jgi:hypothetical protein